jgi:superfamily II DNA or RNA helicase
MITIEKLDEVHLRVLTDESIAQELSDYFKFRVEGYQFMPSYKAKLFDGYIRLYDLHRKTLYVGLYDFLLKFAKTHDYEVKTVGPVTIDNNISMAEVNEYVKSLDLYGHGKPIAIRDYQIDAIHNAINNQRTILLSPTGSGKSLILYSLARWHIKHNRKLLILTPTTLLVEQLYNDFADYSSNNGWSVDDHCQKLYSGFTRDFSKHVMISTWQSIHRQPKAWFEQFDVLCGDEAHQFKAKSLVSTLEKMTHIQHKIGTTGTLDNKKVNSLVLQGIFGPIHRVTTSKNLMDAGTLAKLNIICIVLKYDEVTRKANKDLKYQEEIDFIVSNNKRNQFIKNLTLNTKGNTLVLFTYVERHGAVLYDLIKNGAHDDRKIFFVHGGTEVEDREAIRHITEKESDAIIVASFGTLSTGANIPSIENVIFASPSKSKIRNLQSVGRGLRMKDGKTECKLYDLSDNLSWKNSKNYTLLHFAERLKTYSEENFDYRIVEVNL